MARQPRSVEIREAVAAARLAHLGTADRTGRPQVVPICFWICKERVYSVVDAKPKRNALHLRRLRNIAENPQATVLVDYYNEDWTRLWWTMLIGRASLVHEADVYAGAIEGLRAKYDQYRAMSFAQETNPMIVVEVERVVSWQASS